jgi:hypothetical protein
MSHFLLDEPAFQAVIDSCNCEVQGKKSSEPRLVLTTVTSLSGVIHDSLAFGQRANVERLGFKLNTLGLLPIVRKNSRYVVNIVPCVAYAEVDPVVRTSVRRVMLATRRDRVELEFDG